MTKAPEQGACPHVLIVSSDASWRRTQAELVRSLIPLARQTELDHLAAATCLVGEGGEVILLDCGENSLATLQLLQELRTSPRFLRPYVLICCRAGAHERLVEVLVEGADDFVLDPGNHVEFAVRLRVGLARAGTLVRAAARAAELEELSARQTDFLSVVSHEIRTPLAAILSAANILVRYGSQRPESVERFGRVIQEEARRLTRLINNLLDLTKIEAGQVEWDVSEVPVAELAKQVQEAFAALVGERRVELVASVEPGVPTVVADRDKLMQVLINLISNAIKYSPEGGTVSLRCRPRADGGVRIEVEDDGPGVPLGAEERIFQRFQQLDVDDRNRGTGLGLTISRHIVARHGGRIWAQQGGQRGALFVVELPTDGLMRSGHGPVR